MFLPWRSVIENAATIQGARYLFFVGDNCFESCFGLVIDFNRANEAFESPQTIEFFPVAHTFDAATRSDAHLCAVKRVA